MGEITDVTKDLRAVLRRVAWLVVGATAVLCVSVAFLYLLTRPDPARARAEQGAVFAAYLFGYPLIARPLPTLCEDLQRRNNSEALTYVSVSNETLSGANAAWMIMKLPREKLHVHGVPISTFNDFLVRNLTRSPIDFLPQLPNVNLEVRVEQKAGSIQGHGISVAFSKVGFGPDFSWAMFYAEFSCGTQNGQEYVYLTRDWKHGQRWYVEGIGRISGSPITEQLP
jgi:hypothetical protein